MCKLKDSNEYPTIIHTDYSSIIYKSLLFHPFLQSCEKRKCKVYSSSIIDRKLRLNDEGYNLFWTRIQIPLFYCTVFTIAPTGGGWTLHFIISFNLNGSQSYCHFKKNMWKIPIRESELDFSYQSPETS